MASLREQLRSTGLDAGLIAVGFTSAVPFHQARRHIEYAKSSGRHDTMHFTYANPARSTDPGLVLREARTVISGAWPYASGSPALKADQGSATPAGDVAAYAWRDHYSSVREALRAIADSLTLTGWSSVVLADSNDIADRAAALRSGVGWAGKNSNVLVPGFGSWCVLGTLVTDAPIAPDQPVAEQCGSCSRCSDLCPTAAIVEPGVVDARRCLAWLVQAPGSFPVQFREALGTRVYGCDTCQEVCPPSRNADTPAAGDEVVQHDLVMLLTVSDDVLLDRVGAWYISDRNPDVVRRNALIALGNSVHDSKAQPQPQATAVLDRYARGDSAMLAEHACWALGRIEAATP